MRELLRLHRFPLQRYQRLRVIAKLIRDNFDGNPGVTVARLFLAQIAGLVNDTHPATSQFRFKPKAILYQRTRPDRFRIPRRPLRGILPVGFSADIDVRGPVGLGDHFGGRMDDFGRRVDHLRWRVDQTGGRMRSIRRRTDDFGFLVNRRPMARLLIACGRSVTRRLIDLRESGWLGVTGNSRRLVRLAGIRCQADRQRLIDLDRNGPRHVRFLEVFGDIGSVVTVSKPRIDGCLELVELDVRREKLVDGLPDVHVIAPERREL